MLLEPDVGIGSFVEKFRHQFEIGELLLRVRLLLWVA